MKESSDDEAEKDIVVNVKRAEGTTFALEMKPSDPVVSLYVIVAKETKLKREDFSLHFKDETLAKNSCVYLSEEGIGDGSVVNLVFLHVMEFIRF